MQWEVRNYHDYYVVPSLLCKLEADSFIFILNLLFTNIKLSKRGVKNIRVDLTLSTRQFATLSSNFGVTPKIEVPCWFQKYLYHKNISHHRNLGKCNFNIEKTNRVLDGGRFGHSIPTATVYAVGSHKSVIREGKLSSFILDRFNMTRRWLESGDSLSATLCSVFIRIIEWSFERFEILNSAFRVKYGRLP